jgi:hypothetical protein
MSGIFPASPAPRHIRLRSNQPSRVSIAHSLRRQARSAGAQRFGLVLDFPPMTRAEAAPIFGFCLAQDGRYGTFQYVLPNPLHTPQGVGAIGSPSPMADSTQSSPTENQTGTSIRTRNWSPSSTVLKAMDFFKFASHSKVYVATEDVVSTSSGLATITMRPGALQAIAHGDAIITQSVPFTCSLASDISEIDLDIASLFGFSLELEEAF